MSEQLTGWPNLAEIPAMRQLPGLRPAALVKLDWWQWAEIVSR